MTLILPPLCYLYQYVHTFLRDFLGISDIHHYNNFLILFPPVAAIKDKILERVESVTTAGESTAKTSASESEGALSESGIKR